jgi:hypothetical protein
MRRLLLLALPLLAACGADPDAELPLELTFDGLPALTQGAYGAWLFDADGAPTYAGGFTDGADVVLDAPIESLDDFVDLEITVEANLVPEAPSAAVVLSGAIVDDGAELAFAFDSEEFGGQATLWSPTDDDPDNANAGVWFMVDDGAGGAIPTLELPTLPDGWKLEGWVTTQGVRLTAGRFALADEADSSCQFCGAGAIPTVPGEDFVANLPASLTEAVDLADGETTVVVSLSPDVFDFDPTGEGIFDVELLTLDVAAGQAPAVGMDLTPTGADITGTLGL